MGKPHPDIARLRTEYATRDKRSNQSKLYSFFENSHLFTIQQRERRLLELLNRNGITDLSNRDILDIGCGSGGILLDLVKYGADPGRMIGLDLLHDRLRWAQSRLAAPGFINADAQKLSFRSKSFDLMTQFTAFSSILEMSVKESMASEMLRVLKDDGVIVWYDFWWNPTNQQTAGIQLKEIRHLFPGCQFSWKKITLAPPITRRIVPLSWSFALFLESLKVFNTHNLVLIQKQ